MHQINIRRGLFRLWLLTSLLWVVGIATVVTPAIWVAIENRNEPYVVISIPGAGIFENTWRQISVEISENPWSTVAEIGGIMLGPPVLLFGIGAAFLWAFAGFRESPGKTDYKEQP